SLANEERSRFINISRWWRTSGGSESACLLLRPTAAALGKQVGSTLLGIGGGPELKVWRNGVPLFVSTYSRKPLRKIQSLVALGKPVSAKDRFVVEVCKTEKVEPTGIYMSFWTPDRVNQVCQWKNANVGYA